MPDIYVGGCYILPAGVHWTSSHGIVVPFASGYSDRLHQLYAGRSLVGVTSSPDEREVTGHFAPSHWPQHLQLVAVLPGDRDTDFGEYLPDRPYNRVRVRATTDTWPTDSRLLELRAGTEPGGEVDETNVVDRVLFDADREYILQTPPLAGSGEWALQVAGRDVRITDGNAGDAEDLTADVLAHPPDVAMDSDGNRLAVAVDSSIATISFSYDW